MITFKLFTSFGTTRLQRYYETCLKRQ